MSTDRSRGCRLTTLAVLTAAGALLAAGAATSAETGAAGASLDRAPTFTRDVLPILQANCQSCHRPGGDNYTGMVAPMSLVTYEEARPWAKSIARNVEARKMPPWYAAPEYHGVFENERTLSDEEIDTVVRWAKTGAPMGDPADAPPPLEFPGHGWRIGDPDLVVSAPRYFVPDEADTHYQNLEVVVTEEMLPSPRFVQAIEWRGGSEVVHHIVGFALPPGGGPRYGLGSIAPGEEPMRFPGGYAKLLVPGSKIVFSMHYHKEAGPGTGQWDESQVAFRFHPEGARIRHFVEHDAIGNTGFEIPPGHPSWRVGAARVFEQDTTVIALHPHMHLRGKDAKYVAHYPDGTSEELLSVPDFDFNWQTDYSFVEPKRLPAGTRLEYVAHFDNSADNPDNPDPMAAIDWGPETWDEMMLGYVTWSLAEPRELTAEQVMREQLQVRERAPAAVDEDTPEAEPER
jgi:mono/diheme cytochrome c family protein